MQRKFGFRPGFNQPSRPSNHRAERTTLVGVLTRAWALPQAGNCSPTWPRRCPPRRGHLLIRVCLRDIAGRGCRFKQNKRKRHLITAYRRHSGDPDRFLSRTASPKVTSARRRSSAARLVSAIARGRRWLAEIVSGSAMTDVQQIAARQKCSVRQVT